MSFKHGQFIYSPNIHHRVAQLNDLVYANFVNICLFKHLGEDFGQIDEFDRQANLNAIANNDEQIMSSYISPELMTKLWVITDAKREQTLITTPEEYQKGKLHETL
jgi:hypothetical protein